jgi:PHD/YefM family antitoxin component YafN of YafNO toxin-antitoxin module
VTDKADRSADDDDETDFWLSVPGIRESLIEAEADYAAGRTFSEDEIRAQFGLPPREADRSE